MRKIVFMLLIVSVFFMVACPYDTTTQKQKEFGGWEMLFQYLSEKDFVMML